MRVDLEAAIANRKRAEKVTLYDAVVPPSDINGDRRVEGVQPKKMTTPSGRSLVLEHLIRRGLSQRKACRYLGLSRRVACYTLKQPGKDQAMGERLLVALQAVPRFDYRRGGVAVPERIPCTPHVVSDGLEHPAPQAAPTPMEVRACQVSEQVIS